jgi:hypothetical protein
MGPPAATSVGSMSFGPGFVITDMNIPLRRVSVINLFAEELAGTRSLSGVLGLPLTFQDGTAAVFKLAVFSQAL